MSSSRHNRAAIEFSANVLIVIIISIVIVGFGIYMLVQLQQGIVRYKEAVDSQTQERLKALMLNNNENVAVYPQYITIPRGKSDMVGIGVTNNLGICRSFSVMSASYPEKVLYYEVSSDTPDTVTTEWKFNVQIITNKLGIIMPTNQKANNILINIPKDALSGQYVFTFKVTASCSTGCPETSCGSADYGRAMVYVIVP